jgi:hypothetical protein
MDADKLRELDPEIDAFLNKLPPDLRSGEGAFDPSASDQWEDIRSDVKDLLIAQLLASGGPQ